MISAEAPILFAKAAEMFVSELSLRAWIYTEENKRRTLQKNDISQAVAKYDQFDFLIDIVPRDEIKPTKRVSNYCTTYIVFYYKFYILRVKNIAICLLRQQFVLIIVIIYVIISLIGFKQYQYQLT